MRKDPTLRFWRPAVYETVFATYKPYLSVTTNNTQAHSLQ
jgi:hypothetical protein